MHQTPRMTIIVLLLVTAATAAAGDDLRPWRHPDLDLQFSAPDSWQQESRPGDEGTFEVTDPRSGIHVLLWMTATEMDAQHYLNKMQHMMSVEAADPEPRIIDGHAAWVVETTGTVGERPVATLLAVIDAGASRSLAGHFELPIMQIHCPLEQRDGLGDEMEKVLASVRLTDRLVHRGREYRLYPETLVEPPGLPSPLHTADGRDYLTVRTRDTGRWAIVDVTVENGAPNDYFAREWDKGRQLDADAADFPTLAATGLHADGEIAACRTITGLTIADIEEAARPGAASRAGFIGAEENLLDVLRADNELVLRLGLTHRKLAHPLFQVFNLILRDREVYVRGQAPVGNIAALLYDGHEIALTTRASKGWQESIFADGICGYWEIELRREPTEVEAAYLRDRKATGLPASLFAMHTGEMVAFYIQRYGFYEGATSYRADPRALATIFGLVDLEAIDRTVGLR